MNDPHFQTTDESNDLIVTKKMFPICRRQKTYRILITGGGSASVTLTCQSLCFLGSESEHFGGRTENSSTRSNRKTRESSKKLQNARCLQGDMCFMSTFKLTKV